MNRHIHIPGECQKDPMNFGCKKALAELREKVEASEASGSFVFELPKTRTYKTILNPTGHVSFRRRYR